MSERAPTGRPLALRDFSSMGRTSRSAKKEMREALDEMERAENGSADAVDDAETSDALERDADRRR
jgi:hypothetical protein